MVEFELIWLHILLHHLQAQRRGTAKYLSSPVEEVVAEWDSQKTDGIDRADVGAADGLQARRTRYRTTSTTTTTTMTSKADPKISNADSYDRTVGAGAKVPVYRVRGRNRTKQNHTDSDKSTIDDDSVRNARRKPYQSKAQRANIRITENPTIENSQKDSDDGAGGGPSSSSSSSHSSRKITKTTTELPANDNQRGQNTRNPSNGRRYRVRVVEANELNANGSSSALKDDSKKTAGEFSRHPLKAKKSDRVAALPPIDDEQNYPEHFKALIKAKQSTASPSITSASPGINRFNNFVPKKMAHVPTTMTTTAASAGTLTTTISTATDSSLSPVYRHKLERPNLKILFPSLQKSALTTTDAAASPLELKLNTESDMDPTATDEINTATPAMDTKTNTTMVNKQAGGSSHSKTNIPKLLFSSKIRVQNNDDLSSLSAFRTRSTPLLNFDTFRSSTPHPPPPPSSTNHRSTSVSFGAYTE